MAGRPRKNKEELVEAFPKADEQEEVKPEIAETKNIEAELKAEIERLQRKLQEKEEQKQELQKETSPVKETFRAVSMFSGTLGIILKVGYPVMALKFLSAITLNGVEELEQFFILNENEVITGHIVFENQERVNKILNISSMKNSAMTKAQFENLANYTVDELIELYEVSTEDNRDLIVKTFIEESIKGNDKFYNSSKLSALSRISGMDLQFIVKKRSEQAEQYKED